MNTKLRRRGWLAVGLAALTGTALVAMAPKLGFSRTGPAQLWSDEPPKVSSQTVPAPDWVAIAKTLKPAVVNVSTKRMESGPSLPKGLDPDDPPTPSPAPTPTSTWPTASSLRSPSSRAPGTAGRPPRV